MEKIQEHIHIQVTNIAVYLILLGLRSKKVRPSKEANKSHSFSVIINSAERIGSKYLGSVLGEAPASMDNKVDFPEPCNPMAPTTRKSDWSASTFCK